MIDEIADLQHQYKEVKQTADDIKKEIDRLKAKLLEKMIAGQIRSQEGKEYLAIRTPKTDMRLIDETLALKWVNDTKLPERERYIGLKWVDFKPLVKTWFNETGERIPGTERVDSDTLTIREKKNG